jgi:uncharacterized protein (TIGR03086 family)
LFKTQVVAAPYGGAMNDLVGRAAQPLLAVLRGISSEQLGAATPCREYDVRALISHLLEWGPMLVGAGDKREVGPVPVGTRADGRSASSRAAAGWRAALEAQTADLVAAWSRPEAWQGTAPMGGPLPAPTVGGMALGELVVHGWDLARATGQDAAWPDDVVAFAYDVAQEFAEQGRQMGSYGPAVPVAADASIMDRLLGVTGRDPQWTFR